MPCEQGIDAASMGGVTWPLPSAVAPASAAHAWQGETDGERGLRYMAKEIKALQQFSKMSNLTLFMVPANDIRNCEVRRRSCAPAF